LSFSIAYYLENCYPCAFEETGLVSLLFLSSLKDQFGCLLCISFSLVAYFFLVPSLLLGFIIKIKDIVFFFKQLFIRKYWHSSIERERIGNLHCSWLFDITF
jgi:hypothetical protein